MALHATAPWVGLAAFGCGAGSAVFGALYDTTIQQQVPLDVMARVQSFTTFPSYGIGVIGWIIDGPLAAAIGPRAVFAVGAIYGLASSAVVLTLPAVRAVKWRDAEHS
jgi:MFS family permease